MLMRLLISQTGKINFLTLLKNIKEKRMKAKKVKIPNFEVVSSPTINISQVKRRRFNIIDRYEDWRKTFSRIIKRYEEEEYDQGRVDKDLPSLL